MIAQSFTHRALRRIWRPIHKTLVPRLVRNGASPGPRTILIQLTYTCNLRCWFCNQWGSSGVYHSLPGAELRQMLPLSVLQRVVDDLPWSCEGVELWGGETLQYPDVVALARYIHDAGKSCSLVTNGTLLAKHAKGLVEAGVAVVNVSVDAAEETHDRFRGARGTYQAAMEGIHAVRCERAARGRRRPMIVVGCTLLPSALASCLPWYGRCRRLAPTALPCIS